MATTARQRKADLKLIAAATLTVLVTGALVAGAILVATRGETEACGRFNAGLEEDLHEKVDGGGPFYITGGGNCAFWAALDGDELIAVKARLGGRDCALQWRSRLDAFICGDDTLTLDEVERYPTSIGEGDLEGAWLIDFRSEN